MMIQQLLKRFCVRFKLFYFFLYKKPNNSVSSLQLYLDMTLKIIRVIFKQVNMSLYHRLETACGKHLKFITISVQRNYVCATEFNRLILLLY